MSLNAAAGELRRALPTLEEDPPAAIREQNEVLSEFSPMFQYEEIENLTEGEFLRFLPYKNNRHWTGLARQGPTMTEDMEELRRGLQILLDEERDLPSRVTDAKQMVDGMGKGTLTAILLVAYPDQYGVWNNTSEAALKQLGVWPEFDRGESFGERYQKVNTVLNQLSDEVSVDLWTLDSLLNRYIEIVEDEQSEPGEDSEAGTGEFVAEKHLQKFLVDNWDSIQLSEQWAIYSDADDPEAGVEFPTNVGPADILLRHKTEPRLCVIELKKSRTSDRAVGQLLRYMGWIREHIDELEDIPPRAEVEGMLIAAEKSDHLHYALSAVPDIRFQQYKVDFQLVDAS